MATAPANIVQAEFFHVGGGETSSLEALLGECIERVKDGLQMTLQGYEAPPRIKTVVRFSDNTGELTALALKGRRIKTREKQLLRDWVGSTGLRRWLLDIRGRRLAGRALAFKREAKALAAARLRDAIGASREVLIERPDHTFRPVRKEETHELVESAARAKNVWLFIFQSIDLLSDTDTLIADAM